MRNAWAIRGLFFIALLFLLQEARPVLVPVVIALMLAFVLTPVVRRLRRHGIPEALGAALLVGALLGTGGTVAALLAEPAAQWWERAPRTLAIVLSRVDRWRGEFLGQRSGSGRTASTQEASDPVKARLASEGVALTGSLLTEGARFTLSAASMVILLYFLLASEHWLLSRCIEVLPEKPRLRALVLGGLRALQRDLSRYVLTLSLINLGVGLATALAMGALALPNPGLWGVAAALLNFIPYIGPWGTAAALALAGAMTDAQGLQQLLPAGAFLSIHAIESNLLSPWLIGSRLAINPLSIFLSVLLWAWLWGLAGALIAVPLLISLRCICRRNRKLRVIALYLSASNRPCASLRSLLGPRRSSPAVPG
ncbi:AI-2E family transporter [Mitsuaria sp. WAJ17]|uniref:AI-2E family transporter n=1 Tax=Mitsuaria sp. WAJ17 TaxID=2761452 RepID=UPI0016026DF0|nr:AI-2E family transporter [Mitsuaria sp. WAJ17]MBB2487649.1 AI-2E family transporter [Mitsuaria sp. WAJ17]